MKDHWRDSYDAWKTRSDRDDMPEEEEEMLPRLRRMKEEEDDDEDNAASNRDVGADLYPDPAPPS